MKLIFKRYWKPTLLTLLVLWLAFNLLVAWKMTRPPEVFGRFMSKLPMPFYFVIPFETMWSHARAGQLQVGDQAPDFNLDTLDHSGKIQLATIRQDKPVVLVFGSYT